MKITFNDILIVIGCVVLAWLMTACKTPQPVSETINNTEVKHDSTTNTTTEITTNETIKESDYSHTTEADSAFAALQLRCDSLGNVLISALEQEQGKRTSLELQLKDNILRIQAIQEEFEVIVKGLKRDKEVLIKENTELKEKLSNVQLQEKQEPVIVEKPIPAIVRWLAWIGGAAILYAVLRFALWIYKKFYLK